MSFNAPTQLMPAKSSDIVAEEIAKQLPRFFDPDDVLEVRILDVDRPRHHFAGWCHAFDIPRLAHQIAVLAERASGAYFTPQILHRDCLQRSRNCFVEVRSGSPALTKDEDVELRRWLIIDVDPVRPVGQPSTETEKQSAWRVMAKSIDLLIAAAGVHLERIIVDSGNGYHAYFRFPKPLPGKAAKHNDLASHLLGIVAELCDDDLAKIDRHVFNASRIMRIPGTRNRKGTPSPDRPHRMCAIINQEDFP